MTKVLIINGPNLNLLGRREPETYGDRSFGDYLDELRGRFSGVELEYFQSNAEGEIVDAIQRAEGLDGVVLNAGGYTHTSVAIRDAVAAVEVPVVEVHISNLAAREEFRHTSLITAVCRGAVGGFGLDSYRIAILSLI
jgi:3-dehydroquinate dehydratase-2